MIIINGLYHYGIKRRSGRYPFGSGERPYQGLKNRKDILKYQDKKGELTKKGVKALSNYKDDVDSDKYHDQNFKKGTIFTRVGERDEVNVGRTYVSITQNDKERYIDISETLSGSNLISLKAKEKIKMGGINAQTDSFLKLVETTPIEKLLSNPVLDRNGKETRASRNKRSEELQAYINMFKSGNITRARELFFQRIAHNDDVSKKFFDDMMNKGYNSIIDMNDARWAELPIIILDRNKSLEKVAERRITQHDLDNAAIILKKFGLS